MYCCESSGYCCANDCIRFQNFYAGPEKSDCEDNNEDGVSEYEYYMKLGHILVFGRQINVEYQHVIKTDKYKNMSLQV